MGSPLRNSKITFILPPFLSFYIITHHDDLINRKIIRYDKQKNIAFEKIFKRLDDDKDGKISKDDIDLYGISKRIVKIISPILDELKNGKGTISSEEFIKKCEIIYKGLNYADKKELFIYSMGGAIKSVYDTEPYARRKKVERKSNGKSLRSTSKGINGNNNNKKFLKGNIWMKKWKKIYLIK